MKKIVFFSLLLLFINTVAQAQVKQIFTEDKQFAGGIFLGANLSQVDGDNRGGYNKVGLRSGAVVYYKFGENPWIAQFELVYSQKGSFDNTIQGSNVGNFIEKYRLNVNYFQVPLIINYFYNNKYLLGIGGAYNALINSKEIIHSINGTGNFDPSVFRFERHTFDVVFNGAIHFKNNYIFSVRYEKGVVPMRLFQNTVQGLAGGDQYNNTLTVGLTYMF